MDWKFARNVFLKALALLLLVNFLFAALDLGPRAAAISLYNHIIPGRKRFPFGENPAQSYNVSVYNLDALFAAHEIAGQTKTEDEYRVILIGDSSIWGTLLKPAETLAGQLQSLGLAAPEGKRVRIYNLGYPTMSAFKDLLILQLSMRYQPDLVLWSVTLESLVQANQLNSPLVLHNLERARSLNAAHALDLELPASQPRQDLLERGLLGQRRDLADLVRLQMYGFLWAATGLDQYYPPVYSLALRDFGPDASFYGLSEPLQPADLALDALQAGINIAGETPVLLINEPILISSGENSDIRYNFYYPRWAYDAYRRLLSGMAEQEGWLYLDAWDLAPESEFTNTAVHLSPFGVSQEAERLGVVLPVVIQTGRVPSSQELAQLPGVDGTGNDAGSLGAEGGAASAEPTEEGPARAAQENTRASNLLPTKTGAVTTVTSTSPADSGGNRTEAGIKTITMPTSGACLPPEQWQDMPVLPEYVSKKAIQIYQAGIKNGSDPKIFSVIGDCQSVPQVFLGVFDRPKEYDLGAANASLLPVIDQFSGSFDRKGLARKGGMNVAAVLSPLHADPKQCGKNETPLQCELRIYRPSIVIVSLEEWWSKSPAETYEGYLRRVLDEIIAAGAVPILSTKADNLEGKHAINQTIAGLACEYDLPLWNFWRAVQPLPNHGLWTDGFHLTVGLNDFDDPRAMRSARPMRNLTGLQALDRVWRGLNGK